MKLVVILFALAAVAAFGRLLLLYFDLSGRLSRRGVGVNPLLGTTPGYLEGKYDESCGREGIDAGPELRRLRSAKLTFLGLFIVALLLAASQVKKPQVRTDEVRPRSPGQHRR